MPPKRADPRGGSKAVYTHSNCEDEKYKTTPSFDVNILTNFQYSTVLLSCKYIYYTYIVLYIQPLNITDSYKS